MRRSFPIALIFAAASCVAANAESFFVESNPFILKDVPVRIGVEEFERRIGAVAAEREPIGLVLSGGSARAFAHIGVLGAMEEAGVRPDYIVANSMGAIVALLYAAGYSPQAMEELVRKTDLAGLFDPVVPIRGGLLDARRFAAAMRTLLGGDRDLAGLPIPILIVTEDIKSRRPVYIASGDFATVLTASFALPAFFEPVDMGDLRLSDGGVTNLVPVAAAAAYSSKVIAATALYDRALNLSNPLVVLGRAIDIGKTRRAIAEMKEFRPVVIRCEVEDVSFMDFERADMLIRRGRASAERSMDEVLSLVGAEGPSPLDPAMRARRAAEVDAFIASRERLSTDPRPAPEFSVRPEVRFFDEIEGGSPFLEDVRFLGAAARLAYGRTEASLGGLYRFGSPYDVPATIGAELRAAPFDIGIWSARLYASGEAGDGKYELLADGDFVSVLSAVPLPYFAPRLVADGGARTTEAKESEWYAEGGLGLHPRAGRSGSRGLAAAGELDALWRIDSAENGGPAWRAKLRFGYPGLLEARGRVAGRWSVEGPGTPILPGDGYRGALGRGGMDGKVAAVSNAELAVGSGEASLSFAELALFRAVQLAAYLDTAYAGAEFGSLSSSSCAGLALSADLSFLGLAPIAFSAYWGVSVDGEDWAAGLRVGRFFR